MFFVVKSWKNTKNNKFAEKFCKKQFFKFSPKRWSSVLFPEKSGFSNFYTPNAGRNIQQTKFIGLADSMVARFNADSCSCDCFIKKQCLAAISGLSANVQDQVAVI